jgi:predicted nuclease of predicted toxin-antitoxin system
MAKYLIDVNLPRYFSLWSGSEYEFVTDINDELKDSQIWLYAKEANLTIVTKDADFSDLVLLNNPPPRVIHVKIGNMKMGDFHQKISKIWDEVIELSNQYKLVCVYKDRIECID